MPLLFSSYKFYFFSALLFLLSFGNTVSSQTNYKVLHYTETAGFDHGTRANSLSMFQRYSNLLVTDDQTGSKFDTLSNLQQYDLIIFSNTSGNALLDSSQQNHFEQYIQQGGALLGIHAATDTYRHSSANGTNTGTWDFYAETIGASVQQNPNHVAGTPAYAINKLGSHPTTDSLPNPWNKNEEYYYWENGYLDSNITVVLEVEKTLGPNNQINSYDSARAVSWYKELAGGSRIFYTAAGHANSNFTSDSLFEKHLKNAVDWCLGLTTQLERFETTKKISFAVFPNPTSRQVSIELHQSAQHVELIICTMKGKPILIKPLINNRITIDVSEFPAGNYIITISDGKSTNSKKLLVE